MKNTDHLVDGRHTAVESDDEEEKKSRAIPNLYCPQNVLLFFLSLLAFFHYIFLPGQSSHSRLKRKMGICLFDTILLTPY